MIAFTIRMSRNHGSPSLDQDPVPWESYDICQSAASQVASFGECIPMSCCFGK